MGRAGEHAIFGGYPSLTRAFLMWGYFLNNACGAQDLGLAELDQHRTFGVDGENIFIARGQVSDQLDQFEPVLRGYPILASQVFFNETPGLGIGEVLGGRGRGHNPARNVLDVFGGLMPVVGKVELADIDAYSPNSNHEALQRIELLSKS